jgi:hypothetical protein
VPGDTEIKNPVAHWRLAKPSERLVVNPADSFPYRLLAWAFILLAVILMLSGRRTGSSFFGDLKVFIVLALSQAVLIYLLTKSSNDVFLGTGLKRLKAKVPDETAVPAAVQILQDGSITGVDEGFIWFDGGTLHFKGLQSVWRLNREDIKDHKDWPARMRRANDRVVLAGSGPLKHLQIRLIDPFEDFHTRRRAAKFFVALSRWATERPEGQIESVLPPLDLHPGLERLGPLQNEGVISGLVLVVVNLILLAATHPDFSLVNVVALESVIQFAVVLVLLYLSVRFAWQQILDRRVRRGLLHKID